jgi:hypothetical protein
VVPAQTTTMPPVSQTKIEVGMVVSPGCSKTMFGARFSPSTSQIFAPKPRTPFNHLA